MRQRRLEIMGHMFVKFGVLLLGDLTGRAAPEGLGFVTYLGFVILYGITGIGNGGFLPTILSYTNDALDPHTRSRFLA